MNLLDKAIIILVSTLATYFSIMIMEKVCISVLPAFTDFAWIPYLMISIPVLISAIRTLKNNEGVTA